MKKPFKETKFGKILFGVGTPIVEGALQSVPGGNALIKIVNFLINYFKPKKDAQGNVIHNNAAMPNWFALAIEGALITAIVYSFYTKTITLEQLLEYLKAFI